VDNFATIITTEGNIIIQLDYLNAPNHCKNFKKLVEEKFYDNMFFHRLVPNFVIQIGDPNTRSDMKPPWGPIDCGYTIPHEININKKHIRGVINAGRADDSINPNKDSNGSQFCIFVGDGRHLDNNYTIFAEVIEGLEIADKIVNKPRYENDFPKEIVRVKILMGKH
jgi:peptidyl-prolyl cis-trans isomerase B (cyclophilin B)